MSKQTPIRLSRVARNAVLGFLVGAVVMLGVGYGASASGDPAAVRHAEPK